MEAIFVDGCPVDDIDTALIHDGARLSLATALPGAAGIAMRRNSPYAALRGAITHGARGEPDQGDGEASADRSVPAVREGVVHLRLFNLVMREHAERMLAAGVDAPAGAVACCIARDAECGVWWNDARCGREEALQRLRGNPGALVRLVVQFNG